MFSIAVLPHSPGVVNYHLLLRRETRILGVAPFSFRVGIWDVFVHRRNKCTLGDKLRKTPMTLPSFDTDSLKFNPVL